MKKGDKMKFCILLMVVIVGVFVFGVCVIIDFYGNLMVFGGNMSCIQQGVIVGVVVGGLIGVGESCENVLKGVVIGVIVGVVGGLIFDQQCVVFQ